MKISSYETIVIECCLVHISISFFVCLLFWFVWFFFSCDFTEDTEKGITLEVSSMVEKILMTSVIYMPILLGKGLFIFQTNFSCCLQLPRVILPHLVRKMENIFSVECISSFL